MILAYQEMSEKLIAKSIFTYKNQVELNKRVQENVIKLTKIINQKLTN